MKPLIKIIQHYLQDNPGWHQKSELLERDWFYDGRTKKYNKDTVARMLRQCEEQGLIYKDYDLKGNTTYRGVGMQQERPRYEMRIINGERVAVRV